MPSKFVRAADIDAAVKRAAKILAPDVVRIRYSMTTDWTGEQAIFFRILLSDDASKEQRLLEVSQRVQDTLEKEVKPEELGLQRYFDYRSKSEQDKLREPFWA